MSEPSKETRDKILATLAAIQPVTPMGMSERLRQRAELYGIPYPNQPDMFDHDAIVTADPWPEEDDQATVRAVVSLEESLDGEDRHESYEESYVPERDLSAIQDGDPF